MLSENGIWEGWGGGFGGQVYSDFHRLHPCSFHMNNRLQMKTSVSRCQGICTYGHESTVKRVVSVYIFHLENYMLMFASSSRSVWNNKLQLCEWVIKRYIGHLAYPIVIQCGVSSLNLACNLHESSYRSSFMWVLYCMSGSDRFKERT